jgi:replication-associated recombination protein RarA
MGREIVTTPLSVRHIVHSFLYNMNLSFSRPASIDDVVQQEEVVGVLRAALESGNVSENTYAGHFFRGNARSSLQLPHLLFYGPPGTGKTSTALAIAKQIYGYR